MKVIIIGGNASGLAVASRLNRLNSDTENIIFEEGNTIGYGNCGFPYAFSGIVKSNLKETTVDYFEKRTNSKVYLNYSAIKILPFEKKVVVYDKSDKRERYFYYDKLVIASGEKAIVPNIPGCELPGILKLRTYQDFSDCMDYITSKKPKKAVVVGSGFIGLEVLENLFEMGIKTVLIEREDRILSYFSRAISSLVERELLKRGIEFYKNSEVVKIVGNNNQKSVILKNGNTLSSDLVFFSVGTKPRTEFVTNGIRLDKNKRIVVNEYMQTSNPHIFACGDAIVFEKGIKSYRYPFAGPAIREAKIVAANILGKGLKYPLNEVPSIFKFFNFQIGKIGSITNKAKILSVVYPQHVLYYPGPKNIFLTISYNEKTGEIYGAELFGKDGIDKRLDVLSLAMSSKKSVFELENINLSYSPVFNIPQDILNISGRIASNIRDFSLKTVNPHEFREFLSNDVFLLDVRTKEEFEKGHFSGALNIHLSELENNLSKVPKDKKILVYCATGDRSYQAQLLLLKKGFKEVYNLLGGYIWAHYLI